MRPKRGPPDSGGLAGVLLKLVYSKLAIATTAIIGLILFTFTIFPERSSSLVSYTRMVAWDSLWLDKRLKSFHLEAEELKELYECQYSPRDESKCPSYFAWIHEDLAPWKETGITQEILEESKPNSDYRVVIVGGKMYYEMYHKCFQTRDNYTLWGLRMLLERYPDQIPDLELYFSCNDYPSIPTADYSPGKRWPPPPIFAYDTFRRGGYYNLLIPDWSFWGWPEVNIRPWTEQQRVISAASKPWINRQPLAYWKGNVYVGTEVRTDLLKCNNSNFNVVVYHQNWAAEDPFRTGSLSEQCEHRYKVYAEGTAWSVSQKYIFSCGSSVLHIDPQFWEFWTRSLVPYVHFWPVSRTKLCESIKYAVDWGNAHPKEAEAIGKCGKAYLEKEVNMEVVYQYMVHLLQGYAKLLRFKPAAPEGVQPMSLETDMLWHDFSLPENDPASGKNRSRTTICSIPPHDKAALERIVARQAAGYKRANATE